jgi:hypothetical protein
LDAGKPGVLITNLAAFADALDLSIDVGILRVLGAYFGIARHRRTGCRFPSIRPLLVPPAGFPARPTVVDPCGPLPVDWAVPAVFVPVAVVPREAAAESPGLPRLGDAPPVWFADPADPRLEAAPANPGLDAPADPGLCGTAGPAARAARACAADPPEPPLPPPPPPPPPPLWAQAAPTEALARNAISSRLEVVLRVAQLLSRSLCV